MKLESTDHHWVIEKQDGSDDLLVKCKKCGYVSGATIRTWFGECSGTIKEMDTYDR